MEETNGQLGVQAPNSGAAEVGGVGSVQRENSNIQAPGLGEALPSKCSIASRVIF